MAGYVFRGLSGLETGVRFSSINSLSLSLRLATAETDATAATSAEA